MVTLVIESDEVSVPGWVTDLASFRRWADSEAFPETGRIYYLDREVWVDLSGEHLSTHLAVKNEFNIVLGAKVKIEQLGLYFPHGLLLHNIDADIAVIPDAVFASNAALEDRARLLEGKRGIYMQMEGSPDMVLEVVSRSSVHKDTNVLRRASWKAGIREYWLVDARKESLVFDILRHMPKGYRSTPQKDGWLKSAVFGKSFLLTRSINDLDHPAYTLEVR